MGKDEPGKMEFVLEKSGEPIKSELNPLADIPKIFCAPPDVALGILVDLIAVTGGAQWSYRRSN